MVLNESVVEIALYNSDNICRCPESTSCDFRNAWIDAGKPTHYPSEMVLDRNYVPSTDELPLYKFTRTTYCPR